MCFGKNVLIVGSIAIPSYPNWLMARSKMVNAFEAAGIHYFAYKNYPAHPCHHHHRHQWQCYLLSIFQAKCKS